MKKGTFLLILLFGCALSIQIVSDQDLVNGVKYPNSLDDFSGYRYEETSDYIIIGTTTDILSLPKEWPKNVFDINILDNPYLYYHEGNKIFRKNFTKYSTDVNLYVINKKNNSMLFNITLNKVCENIDDTGINIICNNYNCYLIIGCNYNSYVDKNDLLHIKEHYYSDVGGEYINLWYNLDSGIKIYIIDLKNKKLKKIFEISHGLDLSIDESIQMKCFLNKTVCFLTHSKLGGKDSGYLLIFNGPKDIKLKNFSLIYPSRFLDDYEIIDKKGDAVYLIKNNIYLNRNLLFKINTIYNYDIYYWNKKVYCLYVDNQSHSEKLLIFDMNNNITKLIDVFVPYHYFKVLDTIIYNNSIYYLCLKYTNNKWKLFVLEINLLNNASKVSTVSTYVDGSFPIDKERFFSVFRLIPNNGKVETTSFKMNFIDNKTGGINITFKTVNVLPIKEYYKIKDMNNRTIKRTDQVMKYKLFFNSNISPYVEYIVYVNGKKIYSSEGVNGQIIVCKLKAKDIKNKTEIKICIKNKKCFNFTYYLNNTNNTKTIKNENITNAKTQKSSNNMTNLHHNKEKNKSNIINIILIIIILIIVFLVYKKKKKSDDDNYYSD